MKTESLIKLWNLTQQHPGTSGARAAAGVLLGLYNGTRFPFDLTDLRMLDTGNLTAALDVIGADAARPLMEVHQWLNQLTRRTDFGARFEKIAHEYLAFKRGRCKREYLQALQPARITISLQPEQEAA